MISLTKDNRMLGYKSLDLYPNIFHFVTTRQGGCGQGAYGSFNCSPFAGDDAQTVLHNQERIFEEHPFDSSCLVIPHQTHGCEVALIDEAFMGLTDLLKQERLEGVDALITNQPQACLAISTADCVPLLLYDRANHAVAAVHAGWRGTVQNIALKTLQLMRDAFGTHGADVIATIGPSISLHSFEVGKEVYDAFAQAHYDMSQIAYYNDSRDKYHIDLWEANKVQLQSFGVPYDQIELAEICTYCQHDTFFSARRLGILSGRIVSGIMLKQ